MKAIVLKNYGGPDQLKLEEVARPTPAAGEVLIKIVSSTVTLGDCEIRTLTLPLWTRIPVRLMTGFSRPRNFTPGMEMAGIVAATGRDVRQLREGDHVFGSTGMGMGGNAEFKCRPASTLAIKPEAVSFDQAATISVGGINALHFLRKADVAAGQHVLVNGAGGSIGTYAVQLAKHYGAEVTAVDHGSKLEILKSIGAEHVIDYTRDDFSNSGKKYHAIFDVVYSTPFDKCINALTEGGIYLMANTGPLRMLRSALLPLPEKKKTFFALASENVADLRYLADLIGKGMIKPVIDKIFPLEQTPAAHAYVENGRKTGCVVIRNDGSSIT